MSNPILLIILLPVSSSRSWQTALHIATAEAPSATSSSTQPSTCEPIDKLTDWQIARLTNWQICKFANGQIDKLAYGKFVKFTSWHIGILTNWQTDKLASWWIDKCANWQLDKWSFLQIDKFDKLTDRQCDSLTCRYPTAGFQIYPFMVGIVRSKLHTYIYMCVSTDSWGLIASENF